MNKSVFHKAIHAAVIVGFLLVLVAIGWMGYGSYLTARQDAACGETHATTTTGDQALQRVLDDYSAENGGIGLQVTVIFPDGAVWNGVSGYASREKECPLASEHHLYVGSVTKLYVATMVMNQVEKDIISLDDTLDRWLELPYANSVTVRMLLNHTSGISDYARDIWFNVQYRGIPWKGWPNAKLLRIIRRKPLRFEPGSRHEYSNSNYVLLVQVLEAATGRSFDTLLHETMLDDLGLNDTFFLTHPHDHLIANGYDESLIRLGPVNLGTVNVTGFRGSLAGVILSTSDDVAHFVHALFTGQILADSTVEQMTAFVQAPNAGLPAQIGYGLGPEKLVINGENLIGHTGVVPGYSSIAMHNEEKRYTIVVLSNLSAIDLTDLFAQIQNVILSR